MLSLEDVFSLRVSRCGLAPAALMVITAAVCQAQQAAPASPPITVLCVSKPGERTQCAADTSAGVVLVKSTGAAACLLGKTWGYDQFSIWVADGCSAEFATASTVDAVSTKIGNPYAAKKPGS